MKTPFFLLATAVLLAGCVGPAPGKPIFAERLAELQSRTHEILLEESAGWFSAAESR